MWVIALLFLVSCSGYDREEFRMEVGKKYALKKWPDSVYIDTLDNFLKNEPVKKSQKQKVEMTMNMNMNMSLPEKKTEQPPKKAIQKPSAVKNTESESFPDQFFYALYNLSENPNSTEFGKKHKAKGGETLDDLLLRIYGARAKRVPKKLSESMLKGLNPGVDFSSLSEGETVLLPNVK
jgi:hypothetical protein